MLISVELDDGELAHTLEALSGVAEVLERRNDHIVTSVVLHGVVAKLLRAIEEAT